MPEQQQGNDWQVPEERYDFERVLGNTSPRMRDGDPAPGGGTYGNDVSRAQQQLGRNRLGVRFYEQGLKTGDDPGVFGPKSAEAAKRARFLLGYPRRLVRGRFDELLSRRLMGHKRLTPIMRRRRRKRLEALEGGIGAKAIAEGRKHLGVKEKPPYSNNVLFTRWYGLRGPWCAMFVSYCFVKAGSKAFRKGSRFAACIAIEAAAKGPGDSLQIVTKAAARAGDLVLFHFEGGHAGPNHVGIVVDPPGKGNTFRALEGNTSPSSNANGGIVMHRDRDMSDVVAFVRVND